MCHWPYSARSQSRTTRRPSDHLSRIITENFDLLRRVGARVSFAILIPRLHASIRKAVPFSSSTPVSSDSPRFTCRKRDTCCTLRFARSRARILTARDKRISIKRAVLPTSPGCLHKFPTSLFSRALLYVSARLRELSAARNITP